MRDSLHAANGSGQPDSLDCGERTRATAVAQAEAEVAQLLVFVRQAMAETKWTTEALASEMGYTDASYPAKVLKGEKPLTAAFLVALPDDVEAKFSAKWAKHRGAVVAAPLHGVAAVEALVSGLIGVLAAPQLPSRAGGQLKAELPTPSKLRRRA